MASASSANAIGIVVPPPPPAPGPAPGGGGGAPAGTFVIIGCAGLIVLAALKHAGTRQLTQQEAWSCGLLGLFDPPLKPAVKALKVRG
jgi:hypothetical protein